MTEKQKKDCKKIINVASASAAAVGGGLAQIPGSDSVPLATIQLTMTISLGKVFGKSLTESSAKAAMGSASPLGLTNSLSKEPPIINLSNLSIPLKNVSLKAKPK